jgi:DNA-binding NarL/FixJ family response regulator
VSELDQVGPAPRLVPVRPASRPVPTASLGAADPVAVVIMASDPITAEGTAAYLRGMAGITLLAADRLEHADVILIMATWVTDETLSLMQTAARESIPRDVRFVLVGDGVREHQLLRAVSCGLVSVLPRTGTGLSRIARVIRAVRRDHLEMPEVALGWLVAHLRAIQRDVLAPNGLTSAGLEAREVEVLRLVADGLDTMEIARLLNYSERTVKNIVHGMLTRLGLRNRSHAVAYALRNGLL